MLGDMGRYVVMDKQHMNLNNVIKLLFKKVKCLYNVKLIIK